MGLGERLAELRIDNGLKQKELAEKFKVERSTIGSYERNVSQPSNAMLIKLANFFDVSTDYLLGRTKIRNERETMKLIKDDRIEQILLDFACLDDTKKDLAAHLIHALAHPDKEEKQLK